MSLSLLQPSFLMSKNRSYAQILIDSQLFLTSIAIHLSLRVAPIDLQQGGNSRIPYVHVPAARMSILVYITTVINTFLFLLTKHSFFLRSSGTGTEMGAFSTLFTLVTGGFWGRSMWGTFWLWDARLTSVFISFLIYLGELCFQKLLVEPAPISNDLVVAHLARVDPDSSELDRELVLLMYIAPNVEVVTLVTHAEECLETVIFAIRRDTLLESAHSAVTEVLTGLVNLDR